MDTFTAVTISREEVIKALNSIEMVKTIISPYLATLSSAERNKVPKLTVNSLQFIKKTIDFTEGSNAFTPNFIDVEELRSDYNTIKLLSKVIEPLQQMCSDLNDTILLSGQEALKSSLNYYFSIEDEAMVNHDAKEIYKELSTKLDKIEE